MSKKQRNSRSRQKAQATLSTETLQQRASEALTQQRYKEAVEDYKQLLKKEHRADWQANLAQAYLGRGHELAAKGMFKEAAVIWENRATSCADESLPTLYIEWLLKAERYGNAAQAYQKYLHELEQEAGYKQLSALLGALLLSTEDQTLQQALADIAPWEKQTQAALALLDAYCSGVTGEALEQHLSAISLRSPFRDFRTLIKALVSLESDQAAALQWAAKIPADSPYWGLAQLLPIPALELLDKAEDLSKPLPKQESFMASLYGWDKKQVSLLQNLLKQKEENLFKFVLNNAVGFGKEYSQQLCKQWLPFLHASNIQTYQQQLPLNKLDYERIYALGMEKHNSDYAANAWEDVLTELKEHPVDETTRLKAALIQRRHILCLRKDGWDELEDLEEPLQQCIDWMPEDKTSWLELIELYQQEDKKKDYYELINRAIEQFPQDVEILLTAIAAAQQRKAFKKAAGYAQDILRIDPINAQARRTLIESHLGHARKQLKQEKYHLVSKELEAALQYERGEIHIALHINQALLAYQLEDTDTAQEQLQLAIEHSHSLFGAYAVIFLECQETSLNPELFIKAHHRKSKYTPLLKPWNKAYIPSAAELMRLPQLLSPYKANRHLKHFLQDWQALLKKAAQQSLATEELLTLCDFFKQMELYALLELYAQIALKKSHKHPLFTFYEIYARANAEIFNVSGAELQRLHDALEQAKASDDQRTVLLILNFFKQQEQRMLSRMPPFMTDIDKKLDDIKEMFEDDPEKMIKIAFDGRIPSEQEIDELGPEGLMLRVLQKMNILPDRLDMNEDDDGSKLDDIFDDNEEEEEERRGGKMPRSKRKNKRRK